MAQLKKSQIAAMEKLGMTEEEIAELAQVDDLIDHDKGEKIHFDFDLTPKQQAVAKEYSIAHTRKYPQSKEKDTETAEQPKPKKPFVPDLDNSGGKRNKKENVSKATIVNALMTFLSTLNGCSDIVVITKDKKLNFDYNGKRYDLDLIEKRIPKA